MLGKLARLPEWLNAPATLPADTGSYIEHNVGTCLEAGIEPLIATGRGAHHSHWSARFGEPEPIPDEASSVQKMKRRMKTSAGRKKYGLRKQTVEPVFGIIK